MDCGVVRIITPLCVSTVSLCSSLNFFHLLLASAAHAA
jgi:hypothetical protein